MAVVQAPQPPSGGGGGLGNRIGGGYFNAFGGGRAAQPQQQGGGGGGLGGNFMGGFQAGPARPSGMGISSGLQGGPSMGDISAFRNQQMPQSNPVQQQYSFGQGGSITQANGQAIPGQTDDYWQRLGGNMGAGNSPWRLTTPSSGAMRYMQNPNFRPPMQQQPTPTQPPPPPVQQPPAQQQPPPQAPGLGGQPPSWFTPSFPGPPKNADPGIGYAL